MTSLRFANPAAALALALCAVIGGASPAAAQATTGSLSGSVHDQSGGPIPVAAVSAVHGPTGTTYATTSRTDGDFVILNVRVGGPYTVTVTLAGFREAAQNAVFVKLGEDARLRYQLEVAAVSETVTVEAEASPIINPNRSGTASSIAEQTIETLPTLSRNLNDYARISPYFTSGPQGNGLQVAGRSPRYNNIQVDGSVNNDLFGLADTGTPGGQTESQAVSLDAIQEIQLVIAPYDVRQAGFSGAGINAVTKNGTNAYHGTAYYFFRDEGLVGEQDERKVGTFSDKQVGASIGGPILKDRVFFFANADLGRKQQPSGWSISGSGQNFGRGAEAELFQQILTSQYGYDPGSLDEYTRATDNDKLFARLDFNLSPRHQLTIRHNYVDAVNDRGFPDSVNYWFPNNFYNFKNKTNSTVVQLNSRFGNWGYNEARVAYQTIRDERSWKGDRFPQVQVAVSTGGTLQAGSEAFSTLNGLDQDVIEITDNLTFFKGKHQLTIGTHNELFDFTNYFISQNFGAYYFQSLALFGQGLAQQYNYSYSATSDPKQPALFGVNQLGFYVGDVWKATPKLTLTAGVRWDRPFFPETPSYNPFIEASFGVRNDIVPESSLWSPRLGFNYSFGGDGKAQLRGGIGVFSGRTPYVWLSNNYINNGTLLKSIGISRSASARIPFVTDPDNQPTQIGSVSGATSTEFNMLDPDFDFPSVLRTNLAYDRELGVLGLIGTLEFLYADTLKDIVYQNLNVVPTGQTTFGGRPSFTRRYTTVSGAYYLTNTKQGRQYSVVAKLERPYRRGIFGSASYYFGEAKSVNDGTSSRAVSNWGNNPVPGDPNDPPLSYSRFDVRHRVNLALSLNRKLGRFDGTLALFYNGQSGRPYNTTFSGAGTDVNGDRRFDNDLFYVPRSASEVIITNGTWEELDGYIESDPGLRDARGQIVGRYASRLDWTNQLDLRLTVGIPVKQTKVELTADVFNVFSEDIYEPAFPGLAPVAFEGIDAGTGLPRYRLLFNQPNFRYADLLDLPSRWQAQFGLRFRF